MTVAAAATASCHCCFDSCIDCSVHRPFAAVTIRLLDPPLHEFLPRDSPELDELCSDLARQASVRPSQRSPLAVLLKGKIAGLQEVNPMLGLRGCRLGIRHPGAAGGGGGTALLGRGCANDSWAAAWFCVGLWLNAPAPTPPRSCCRHHGDAGSGDPGGRRGGGAAWRRGGASHHGAACWL